MERERQAESQAYQCAWSARSGCARRSPRGARGLLLEIIDETRERLAIFGCCPLGGGLVNVFLRLVRAGFQQYFANLLVTVVCSDAKRKLAVSARGVGVCSAAQQVVHDLPPIIPAQSVDHDREHKNLPTGHSEWRVSLLVVPVNRCLAIAGALENLAGFGKLSSSTMVDQFILHLDRNAGRCFRQISDRASANNSQQETEATVRYSCPFRSHNNL